MSKEIQKIVCATDFSESSRYAYEYALALAGRHNGILHLVHVMEPSAYSSERIGSGEISYSDRISQRLEEFRDSISNRADVTLHIVVGIPYIEIVKIAESIGADLIVIGTHGRTGIRHMLIGSVAEKVVRTASCPVMTVRHPDHAIPD